MKKALFVSVAAAALAVTLAPVAQADVYDEFYAAVDWLGKKYGALVYVGAEPMEYGTYAATQGDVILLNSGYIVNADMFHEAIASDIYSGFHRGANCTAPQYVAAHEFAHALDNLTGHTARSELLSALNSGLSGTVSRYALESPSEAIAESFAAVECDTPTPAESAIYTMLVN